MCFRSSCRISLAEPFDVHKNKMVSSLSPRHEPKHHQLMSNLGKDGETIQLPELMGSLYVDERHITIIVA